LVAIDVGVCVDCLLSRVSAHTVDVEEGESRNGYAGLPSRTDKAVFLVKFAEKVLQRDAALER